MSGIGVNVIRRKSEITRHMTKVERKAIPAAVSNALNQAARKVRTRANKRLRGETGLPAGSVAKRTKVIGARRNRWRAVILVFTAKVNLLREFAPMTPLKGKNKGQTKLGPFYFPNGFLQRLPATGRGAMLQRKSKKAYPLDVGVIDFREPSRSVYRTVLKRIAGPAFSRSFVQTLSDQLKKRGFSKRANQIVGGA